MALDSDYFVDRTRLKRRLAFWRIVAVVAVIVSVAAAYGRFGDGLSGGDHIARVDIKGVIVHDNHRLKKISDIAKNDDVKAVMIRIDSPGGTVVGGEGLVRVGVKVRDRARARAKAKARVRSGWTRVSGLMNG